MPTLAFSSFKNLLGGSGGTLTSASFTPQTGDIIVVKAITADSTAVATGTPSGGGWTYTSRVSDTFNNHVGAKIWTAPVTAGGTAQTVSLTISGTSTFASMIVEVWRGAKLAATPATCDARGSGAPSTPLTTVAANSVVSWANGDWAAVSPTGHTYNTTSATPTEEAVDDQSASVQYVAYYAYQSAATAGSQTLGLTAPTGQTWTLIGIEIQDNPSGASANLTTAQVNIAAPAPTLAEQLTLAVAQETISAPQPSLNETLTLSVAGETINALPPTLGAQINLPVAQVTINALAPAISTGISVGLTTAQVNIATPAPTFSEQLALAVAQVNAAALAPTLGITLGLAAAQVSINAPPPTVQTTGPQTVSLTTAQVSGSSLAPTLAAQLALSVAQEAISARTLAVGLQLTLTTALVAVQAYAPAVTSGAFPPLDGDVGGSATSSELGGTVTESDFGGTVNSSSFGGTVS